MYAGAQTACNGKEGSIMKRQWTEEELEQRIIDRLGERSRKMQLMQEWERPRRTLRLWKPAVTVMALAACLVVVLYILPVPSGNVVDGDFEEVSRGTGLRVKPLIREGRYEEALEKVDSALRVSKQAVRELSDEAFDEEAEYLLEAEEQKMERLQALKEKILKKMNE